MSEMHGAEKDATCACRWERDSGGRMDFRDCSRHYVARVFPPARVQSPVVDLLARLQESVDRAKADRGAGTGADKEATDG